MNNTFNNLGLFVSVLWIRMSNMIYSILITILKPQNCMEKKDEKLSQRIIIISFLIYRLKMHDINCKISFR